MKKWNAIIYGTDVNGSNVNGSSVNSSNANASIVNNKNGNGPNMYGKSINGKNGKLTIKHASSRMGAKPKIAIKCVASLVTFCLFISSSIAFSSHMLVSAASSANTTSTTTSNASNASAASNASTTSTTISSGEVAGGSSGNDRKADSLAMVVELAIKMARQDVGSTYAEAEAEAVAEAARKEAEARAAAEKAAAEAAAAAAAAERPSSQQSTSTGGSSSGGRKIVYITVDDGPSSLTGKFLDIFEKHGVRATFFVVGKQAERYPEQIKRMQRNNHYIANHSYSHDYSSLYSSKSSLSSELKKWDEAISKILGTSYHARVFRFPGGSTYSRARQYRDYVKELGYSYYDWTCLNGDAEISNRTANNLYNYLVQTYKGRNEEIVLIHDTSGKQTTVDMLERMIKFFKDNGYEFRTLAQK